MWNGTNLNLEIIQWKVLVESNKFHQVFISIYKRLLDDIYTSVIPFRPAYDIIEYKHKKKTHSFIYHDKGHLQSNQFN